MCVPPVARVDIPEVLEVSYSAPFVKPNYQLHGNLPCKHRRKLCSFVLL